MNFFEQFKKLSTDAILHAQIEEEGEIMFELDAYLSYLSNKLCTLHYELEFKFDIDYWECARMMWLIESGNPDRLQFRGMKILT